MEMNEEKFIKEVCEYTKKNGGNLQLNGVKLFLAPKVKNRDEFMQAEKVSIYGYMMGKRICRTLTNLNDLGEFIGGTTMEDAIYTQKFTYHIVAGTVSEDIPMVFPWDKDAPSDEPPLGICEKIADCFSLQG